MGDRLSKNLFSVKELIILFIDKHRECRTLTEESTERRVLQQVQNEQVEE